MDLKDVHDLLLFYTRKTELGHLSPEEIDRVLNRAQYDIFEEIKPTYATDQRNQDLLRPFKKTLNLTNGSTVSGVVTLPSDYYHLLGISLTYVDSLSINRKTKVEIVDEEQLDDRLDDDFKPATVEYPLGVFQAATIQLYPAQPVAGTFRYLKKPATCHFVYTGSRPIVYNSGSSTQLEWNEDGINMIVARALPLLGINLQDGNLLTQKDAQ